MFQQSWQTEYKGHRIKVNNKWFGPSELFIDEKIQDKATGIFSVGLIGKIQNAEAVEEIKVSLTATLLSIDCTIFADNEAIYTSKK